jgi:hypothetical protein
MRAVFCAFVLVSLSATSGHATEFFNYNNSVFELKSSGSTRQFVYLQPRAGLPVTAGTVVFSGTRSGNTYSGTAYVFSAVCGAIGYSVTGIVSAEHASVTLRGQVPVRDAQCNVTGTRDNVLVFQHGDCEPPDEPEFEFNAQLSESSEAQEGASCPYLYAWNEHASTWQSYGKVIHRGQGLRREMTQVVRLSAFTTKFRLAEEEPEDSFIDQVELRVQLKTGSILTLKPTNTVLADRDAQRLRIPAFDKAEFAFELPKEMTPDDIETASISITGYYERRAPAPVCRRVPPISYIVGDAEN